MRGSHMPLVSHLTCSFFLSSYLYILNFVHYDSLLLYPVFDTASLLSNSGVPPRYPPLVPFNEMSWASSKVTLTCFLIFWKLQQVFISLTLVKISMLC